MKTFLTLILNWIIIPTGAALGALIILFGAIQFILWPLIWVSMAVQEHGYSPWLYILDLTWIGFLWKLTGYAGFNWFKKVTT